VLDAKGDSQRCSGGSGALTVLIAMLLASRFVKTSTPSAVVCLRDCNTGLRNWVIAAGASEAFTLPQKSSSSLKGQGR
jgi:hypothetical protein